MNEQDDKELGKMDLQTLLEAEEIKRDKKKMKHVLKHAKNKMASIQSIQDLKDAYNAKYGEGKLFQQRKAKMEKAHEGSESKAMEKAEGADEKEID